MNKKLKVLVITLVVLVAVLLGGNYYAKLQLKSALKDFSAKNDFAYNGVSVNLLFGSASISEVSFNNEAISLNADKTSIKGFGYRSYFFSDTIRISTLHIDNPKLVLKPKPDTEKEQPKDSTSTEKAFYLESLSISEGYIKGYKEEGLKNLSLHLIDFEMNNILSSGQLLEKPLPFTYQTISSEMDSLYLSINKHEDFKVENLSIQHNNMTLRNLQIIPKYERDAFQNVIPYEKDLITLDVPEVSVKDFSIGNHSEKLLFQTPKITLNQPDCNIYRDKNTADDTRIKPMYSKMLRDLKFDLIVDSLLIDKANLVYEERAANREEPGKVIFKNLEVIAANISNASVLAQELPITTLDFSTTFMENASLDVQWQFNVNNEADYFRIKGVGSNITDKDINYFFVPSINMKALGTLDKLSFKFSGNRNEATGEMQINYNMFKVEVLRKDSSKKNGFLTTIANLFLDNREKSGLVKKDNITAQRDHTKSFWNYFWLCIRNGALESLTSKS